MTALAEKSAIKALFRRLQAAHAARDANAVQACYAPDARLFELAPSPMGWPRMSGAPEIWPTMIVVGTTAMPISPSVACQAELARAPAIIERRDRIRRQAIQHRRSRHRKPDLRIKPRTRPALRQSPPRPAPDVLPQDSHHTAGIAHPE